MAEHRVVPYTSYVTVRRATCPEEIKVDNGRIGVTKAGNEMLMFKGQPVFGYSDKEGNFDVYHKDQIVGQVV